MTRKREPTESIEAARPLPHDLDAERAVLGAILVHSDSYVQVEEVLRSQDFYRDAHRRVYAKMGALAEARTPIDFLTLKTELGRSGELDEIGGPAYLASLSDGVPHGANVVYYAKIVREKAQLRELLAASDMLCRHVYDGEALAVDVAGRAADALYALSGQALTGRAALVSDLLAPGLEQIERAYNIKGVTGLSTGFQELDDITAGMHPADLILIAARTSVGKTALGVTIARHVARTAPVLICSMEMTRMQLFFRLLAAEGSVDSHRLRTGHLQERDWPKLSAAMNGLGDAKLWIDDRPQQTVSQVRARAVQLEAEGHRPVLIVVDYIQLMKGQGRNENRTQEVGSISRGLKALAKELDIPIVALAQLSRKAEGGKDERPQLWHLRESGDLENDADTVLLLFRAEMSKATIENEGLAELIVAKQRNGPLGTIKLAFIKEYVRFEPLTWASEEAPQSRLI